MQHNPIRWFEIHVQDMARAQKFYEAVLAVRLESLGDPNDPDIVMKAFPMFMDGPGAAGALVKAQGSAAGAGGTLVYFGCDDCATEAGRVSAAGGTVQREKMSIGEHGFIALATDTEGNPFGLHSMT